MFVQRLLRAIDAVHVAVGGWACQRCSGRSGPKFVDIPANAGNNPVGAESSRCRIQPAQNPAGAKSSRGQGMESAQGNTPNLLGVFAKEPVAGAVKTRLAEASSPEFAAALAEVFLRDIVRRLARIQARRCLVFAPATAGALFAQVGRNAFAVEPQGEGDLGRRMEHFLTRHFESGAQRIVVVGTDSPTLPVPFVAHAFLLLGTADVVLGPATDGGYYLLGCAGKAPPIFHDIDWGSASVLADTIARLRGTTRRLALLPPWYDVDTLNDVRLLVGHIAAMRCAGSDPDVLSTEELLESRMARTTLGPG